MPTAGEAPLEGPRTYATVAFSSAFLISLETAFLLGLGAGELEELLGIDRAAQERQTNLRYVKDFAGALEEAKRADVQAVFLLNPTAVAQLKAVADAGEIMPQKSTYFFPKLASGLLIDAIDPAEDVPEGT